MHQLQHTDPECVCGIPLDFHGLQMLHRELEFEEALEEDRLPPHEIEQHKSIAA